MAKKTIEKPGSVTFQLAEARKEKLEAMAFRLGLRRVVEGQERGNISAIINLLVEFCFENIEVFADWLTKRATGAA